MSRINWMDITKEDVLRAIDKFNTENPDYPEPKVTSLIYNNQKLPAKHIRGMAYEIAYGKEISKSDYGGGIETVRFFERLGFEMYYTGKSEHHKNMIIKKEDSLPKAKIKEIKSISNSELDEKKVKHLKNQDTRDTNELKIGLYLQTNELKNPDSFQKAIEIVKKADFDIFLLPEFSYVPFYSDLLNSDISDDKDIDNICKYSLDLSKELGKAIVLNSKDKCKRIFSIYANVFADNTETEIAIYIKHTMTACSAFDLENYDEYSKALFEPIIYKGYKIGMTICYDCNYSLFSRAYGLQNVDIILNSTGGDVVYDKWYKYNKVRSIENNCYNLITMGGNGTVKNPKAYVYGFNRLGKELEPVNIVNEDNKINAPGGIYVYDLSLDDGCASQDTSLHQKKTLNKSFHLSVPIGNINKVLEKAEKLQDNIYVYEVGDVNTIFLLIEGNDILKPEKVLPLLYSKEIKDIRNKRYIIVNKHKEISRDFFNNILSVVLKVRSMENFCAVILESNNYNECYQSGKNRTSQALRSDNGMFNIDLSRTTGPEAIWKNKDGMKAKWRDNFEWLIDNIEGFY